MREMRFLTRCRRRQRGQYADGARHNGLREVEEARTSGLHAPKVAGSHPANFELCRKKSHFAKKSCIFRLGPPSRNGKPETLIWRKMLYQNVRCDFEAFWSSNAAKYISLHPATPRGGDHAGMPTPRGRRRPPSLQRGGA